jgi:hypothetical protein
MHPHHGMQQHFSICPLPQVADAQVAAVTHMQLAQQTSYAFFLVAVQQLTNSSSTSTVPSSALLFCATPPFLL